MDKFTFRIEGVSPLLCHADSIDWSDRMKAWSDDPKNKKDSVAGDDRTPAFRWIGCFDHDGKYAGIPLENLMKCILRAATKVPIPGNRHKKTFKSEVMAEMVLGSPLFPILVGGKNPIEMSRLNKLLEVKDFAAHCEAARNMGFILFCKRARVGQSKHIRVRPRIDSWAIEGSMSVFDDKLARALPEIFEIAGRKIGLGSWRPDGPTPGMHGRFSAKVTKI